MRTYILKYSLYLIIAGFPAINSSCNKDYIDPARAPEDEALTSSNGLTGVAVGLQRVYTAGRASSLYNRVTANGFVTDELILRNAGNVPELQLSVGGGTIDGTNTILAGLWTSSNKIIYDADRVILGAETLNDKSYASGLIAYAIIFKALAMGDLSMFWTQVPAGVGENVTFISRTEGFTNAIAEIDKALTAVSANPISASFLSSIPAGIDIVNTLHALKARYALFAGDYNTALTSASAVDLSKKSVFNFDAVTLNPIFETATSTNNVYQPIDDTTFGLPVGLQPDPGDLRKSFYTAINPTVAPRVRIKGFGEASTTPIPIYLPGEITLIKAEAYARQASVDLTSALMELNKVITKVPSVDPFGLGAGLPSITGPLSQEEMLLHIYKNRCIELFMSGLKLEDTRRFNRPVNERKITFFPYPFIERDNNPNTPPDPGE